MTDAAWPRGLTAVTLFVEDVASAKAFYLELLNGPLDRPWGVRTAAFRDPAGHVWEIAH